MGVRGSCEEWVWRVGVSDLQGEVWKAALRETLWLTQTRRSC